MTKAVDIMHELNPNILIAYENNLTIGFEDFRDSDGRWYRLEYKSTHSGDQAVSYCRYQPWGNIHKQGWQCHLHPNGLICTGSSIHELEVEPDNFNQVKQSPYALKWIIERSHLWCVLYSYFRENGHLPAR